MSENHSFPSPVTGHIGLNVGDLDRSVRFYGAVFGFDTLLVSGDESRQFAFLGTDGEIVLTLWQQSTGRFKPAHPGLHHLSFRVPDVEQVRAAERRLHALDVPFHYEGIVPHEDGADSGGLFFEDPDGIRLEIYTPAGVDGGPAPVPGAPSCGFF
jgi:catechol 2,3-dioxygenase-like lactoylglutathione lyase family enzyme